MASFNLGFRTSLNHLSCFSSLGVILQLSEQFRWDSLEIDESFMIFKFQFMHQTVIVPKVCSPKNPCSDPKFSWGCPPPHSLLEKLGEAKVTFSIIFLQFVTHKSTVARTVMCRQDGRGRFPVLLDDHSKCRTNSQRKSQLS